MWKTTAPGWTNERNSNRVGHDIEIVNGRKLKTSGEKEQVSQFSVTQDEMYKNNTHGDQFAELNCENVGALYQDILTTPNSECYWDLDYAGRWCQNSMYVVAMSANDAQNYTTSKQIEALIKRDDVKAITTNQEGTKGTTIKLTDGVTATLWKVTSKETAGQWNDHNGIYNVPSGENNYLTRFFFVSAGGAKRNDGDTPDMIDFSNLPWHSFADRGLLLDLNTILPQEDILPWLWKSVSYHGANYTFPGCFTVETLVGKQSKLGDHQHWTVQGFLNLADSSDMSIFSGMSRELFLFYMEQYLLDAFLDEETKTCSFDSEEFRSLLDYAATLDEPEELGFEVENSMLLIRRDLALAEPVILSSVGQMHSAESYTVGEPLAWVGWPGPNGTKVRPDAEIAVFKNTDHTDGAAAFLQFLLSDTSQTVLGRFAFPMTASAFESEIAAAMEARNTNDPDLATEFTVDGTVYPVVPLSEEDAARYETFFENISAQIYYPWQAANILEAECGALWAGERTAAETAAQIQKRMELYLAENAG